MRTSLRLLSLVVAFAVLSLFGASFGDPAAAVDPLGVSAVASSSTPALTALPAGHSVPAVPYLAAGMMLLVNTSSRSRKRNAKGHFLKGHTHHKRKRKSPRRNPGQHAKKSRRKSHAHSIHLRRNPSSALMRDVAPIAIGAAGALGTDVIAGAVAQVLPMPASLAASPMLPWITTGIKAGLAVGAGYGVGKAFGKPVGQKFMVGALTVIGYGLARTLLESLAPVLPLGNLQEHDYPQIGFVGDNFNRFGEVMPDVPALHGVGIGEDFGFGEVFSQE